MTSLSFQSDIAPIFVQFRSSMLWRLDLTNYEDMKANAALVYNMIGPNGGMPPQPYAPLAPEQVARFLSWMTQGCPP